VFLSEWVSRPEYNMQVNVRVPLRVLMVSVSASVSVSVSVCCTAHRYRSHRRAAWPCHRLSSVPILTSRCAGRCSCVTVSVSVSVSVSASEWYGAAGGGGCYLRVCCCKYCMLLQIFFGPD